MSWTDKSNKDLNIRWNNLKYQICDHYQVRRTNLILLKLNQITFSDFLNFPCHICCEIKTLGWSKEYDERPSWPNTLTYKWIWNHQYCFHFYVFFSKMKFLINTFSANFFFNWCLQDQRENQRAIPKRIHQLESSISCEEIFQPSHPIIYLYSESGWQNE